MDQNFNSVSIFVTANCYVHDWTDSRILENPILSHESSSRFEASCIVGTNVASVVVLLYQEYRSIVLVRQASNPHQNTVWTMSGLRAIVRTFARILALG